MSHRLTIALLSLTLALLLLPTVCLAQGAPFPTPPGYTVPIWTFSWVLALATSAGTVLLLVIRILWAEARKKSALSEEERYQLTQLYEMHNQRDDDQVPLWYVPRSWIEQIQNLSEDLAVNKALLTKLVEQNDGISADLREQIKERLNLHDRQQTKMLKLAVRVQRAVEALAGLNTPDIESDLDDSDDLEV